MRNIFLFLRRYSTLLFFLLLQALCIYFIVSYSKYHEAAFGSTANRFTGSINKQYNKIEYYFQLKRTNDSLVKANEVLYNKLRSNFNIPDSANKLVIDTFKLDSLTTYKKFNYLAAKVISNSVSLQSNYIVLFGSNVHKFKKGMGIVGVNNEAVGIVTEVDGDYAAVMSLLHKDSKLSAKLFKGDETGILTWDGAKPNILSLNNIPKSAKIAKGDTIVTSGRSAIFPRGIFIGRVTDIVPETKNNNYNIVLKSAADFNSLEYVYAIESLDAEPVKNILDKAKAAAN